jgi:hypothetical protein
VRCRSSVSEISKNVTNDTVRKIPSAQSAAIATTQKRRCSPASKNFLSLKKDGGWGEKGAHHQQELNKRANPATKIF